MQKRVCAIVVTYNRKDLLQECLQALIAQSQQVNEILVVNNASTDGTDEMIAQAFPTVQVLELPRNIGGAGGFYAGMKWAYSQEFDWIWLMDDDTIAAPNALSELLAARARFDASNQPKLLASKVVWTDGSLHPMNLPKARGFCISSLALAAESSTVSLRATSFVSLLLHRSLIEQYGLPIAGYFIWNDDAEYTARILRQELGVLVPSSIAVHKTAKKYASFLDAGSRYYYEVRNKIWMITRSNAWSNQEKLKLAVLFLQATWNYLKQSGMSLTSIRIVVSGLVDGLFKAPALEPDIQDEAKIKQSQTLAYSALQASSSNC